VTGRTPNPSTLSAEALTDYRLGKIEEAVTTMADSMKTFVALEQKHSETREGLGRAFKEVEDIEQRVRTLELSMATVKQSSGWLGQSIAIGATAVVTGVVTIVLPHVMK
jgi:NifU-like protein involved in Fe-S cluster formation